METFRIDVPDDVLGDLRERLARTRFTNTTDDANWDHGTSPAYLRELCGYWANGFDWREEERKLNAFNQYRAEVDGAKVHFIYEKGRGPNAIPLLLLHGWPDSFVRFTKLIPLLTNPAAHDAQTFDVVVPSLPGYAFSDRPNKRGLTFGFADLFHTLMSDVLGYPHYAVHGGDWGGTVAEHLARSHGSSLLGIHLTDVPFHHVFQQPHDTTHEEKKYLKHMEDFQKKEGAYALVQATKPRTLANALVDSPAGLASWIVEKFRDWSDCDGNVESRFTRDELLTNLTIYWATQTIDSSFLTHWDMANAGAMRWISEMVKTWLGSKHVPAAFALFPKDLVPPPRAWAERFFDVRRWTEMPRGGHFAAMEEPELLAEDIRETFTTFCAAHTEGVRVIAEPVLARVLV